MKSNYSLYLLYYAEACNKFAGHISASLRPDNSAALEEMSQRWRAVGNTVSDLTGQRFEPDPASDTNALPLDRQVGKKAEEAFLSNVLKALLWPIYDLSTQCCNLQPKNGAKVNSIVKSFITSYYIRWMK